MHFPGGKSASSFMERCISFIGDNAVECVKTNAFLNLPKEALVKLISSDFLCLEEEEVWRCALAWAKQRAGVTQPTAHWTEEERARVCSHLAPLMQHVRLLLIDSAVFAEEVEPTGAVPMELSLERYRRAALTAPTTNRPTRTQPRLAINLFAGTLILQHDKSQYQSVINNWCGTPKQSWRLVFRASAHGFSAQAFHTQCDSLSPLLIIVQSSRNEVFGGYTTVGWSRAAGVGYIPAETGFLFGFTGTEPTKYNLTKRPYALCNHPDCGPIFGAGADLFISNNCNANTESYSNLHSYGETSSASCSSLSTDYNFTVIDYEVFTPKVT